MKAVCISVNLLTSVGSKPISISAGKASKLAILGQSANSNAGAAIGGFSVVVTDTYGNKVSTDHSTVIVTISSGQFADGRTAETVTAVKGQATFSDLKINAVGSYKLTVSDGLLPRVVTSTSSISPAAAAAAAKLVMLQQPTTGLVGQGTTTNLQVATQDQFGNLVKTDTSTMTITLASGKFSNGSSSMTVKASGGIATFSRLTFGVAGTYALMLSDGSLARATSQSIVIRTR